jgi:hypothetical protein
MLRIVLVALAKLVPHTSSWRRRASTLLPGEYAFDGDVVEAQLARIRRNRKRKERKTLP